MGYDCANCKLEFSSPKEMVQHMADAHNTYFLEGDDKLKMISLKYAKSLKLTNPNKYQKAKEIFENYGIDLEE